MSSGTGELSTSEPSPTPSATRISSTTPVPTDEEVQAEESGTAEESEEILLIPTLAPTATPGVIYEVVNQVVEATKPGPNALSESVGSGLDQPGDFAGAGLPDADPDLQADIHSLDENCPAQPNTL